MTSLNKITTRYIAASQYSIYDFNLLYFSISTELSFGFETTQTFLIKPYGTSRIRYEIEPVLDINISQQPQKQTACQSKTYTICIAKNAQASFSRNASLFWGNAFNIPIEIWAPIQTINARNILKAAKITSGGISQLLPENYGTISVANGGSLLNLKHTTVNERDPLIGIVVPFYSRASYVSQFLESFKKTNLKNCIIVFVDESLTKDVTVDHKAVHDLVKTFELDSTNAVTPLIKIYKNVHGNMNDSILYGLDLLYNYCDILSTVDSDTIHNKNWIGELVRSHVACQTDNPEINNILVSGFNVESERHGVIDRTNPEYITKTSVGGCHMMFSKEMYIGKVRHCLHSHKWDSNIIENLKRNSSESYKIVTTNPSCIQHIGIVTSVRVTQDNNLVYGDHATDFIAD
jgi:hypothetical protein